jgi:hypothetical protein
MPSLMAVLSENLNPQLKRGDTAMAKIVSIGYRSTLAARAKANEDSQLLETNLSLLLANSAKIIETSEFYFCWPKCCWSSWPYLTGDGPLYLGYLMEGYRNQKLIETCPSCGTKTLMVTCFGGSLLSGANSCTGICLSCSTRHSLKNIPGFIDRMQFICRLRDTRPLHVPEWRESDGEIFDWGGNGLKPAMKKAQVARQLYEPLPLAEVIDRLSGLIQ